MLIILDTFQAHAEEEKEVLILANRHEGSFEQVIDGFKAQFTSFIKFTEIYNPTSDGVTQAIRQNNPALIFALGEDASKLAQQQSGTIPIVTTLVINDQVFKAPNSTGVSLTHSLKTQIQWLKKLLPEKNRVGVLFNIAENAETVQTLKNVVDQEGLSLKAIPVESPRQLPDALAQLNSDIDVLLAIPDSVVLTPTTVKEVMLATFRNRVPLVGLSENWVKSGALYALSWDFDDLGHQCGQQAQKLLRGQSIKSVTPEAPRKVTYAINTNIAEQLNVDIEDSLIQKAKMTFN